MTRTLATAIAIAANLPFSAAAADQPEPLALAGVEIVERLGESIPRDAVFTDSTGRGVRLGGLLAGGRPVVLTLGYYDCPALCSLVLRGQVSALKVTALSLGVDYDAITVSIDPREGRELAAERKTGHLKAFGRSPDSPAWSFLTGEKKAIEELADSVGFRFRRDPSTGEYAHAAAMVVLTPEGRVSRYLYGIDFNPRDLRLALVEASDGRVGTSFDRFLLACYRYDPAQRRYTLFVARFLQAGGVLILLGLGGLLGVLWRRELKGLGGASPRKGDGSE